MFPELFKLLWIIPRAEILSWSNNWSFDETVVMIYSTIEWAEKYGVEMAFHDELVNLVRTKES